MEINPVLNAILWALALGIIGIIFYCIFIYTNLDKSKGRTFSKALLNKLGTFIAIFIISGAVGYGLSYLITVSNSVSIIIVDNDSYDTKYYKNYIIYKADNGKTVKYKFTQYDNIKPMLLNNSDYPVFMYEVEYSENPNKYDFIQPHSDTIKFEPHTITKIEQKPDYYFTPPPASIDANKYESYKKVWILDGILTLKFEIDKYK